MRIWCLIKNNRVVAKINVSNSNHTPSIFDFKVPLFIYPGNDYRVELRDATNLD